LWIGKEEPISAVHNEKHLQSHMEQLTEEEHSIMKSLSVNVNEGEQTVDKLNKKDCVNFVNHFTEKPIAVDARSKARIVFARSNTEIVGSNPT
jgi:hypothetical protein